MAFRPIALSIKSATEIDITFSDNVNELLSIDNFSIESLNGSISDVTITGLSIDNAIVSLTTRPHVPGGYYLLHLLDATDLIFSDERGRRLIDDDISRKLFFIGTDSLNPIRDNILSSFSNIFNTENSLLKNIVSAQSEEFIKAQRAIGQLLSDNYISVSVTDELRTRSNSSFDRLANENAFEVLKVSKQLSGQNIKKSTIDYSQESEIARHSVMPEHKISLLETFVSSEEVSLSTSENSFNGFLISLSKQNILKLISVKLIRSSDEQDCDGNIGTEYDIEKYGYSLKDGSYDPDLCFEYSELNSNQVLLSEFGNLVKPNIADTYIVSYIYADHRKDIIQENTIVYNIDDIENEPIPTNSVRFFLKNAPIVNDNNEPYSVGGVSFQNNENDTSIPNVFNKELIFNLSKMPSKLGEYSINYLTGEVFAVGSSIVGEGTDDNSYVASYQYRKEYSSPLDYVIDKTDLVVNPGRPLLGSNAKIDIKYEDVFAPNVDYKALCHIEKMNEHVANNLSSSFSIKTANSPITNVFRILNQTTGEVYKYLYNTDTDIYFSGSRSPDVRSSLNEQCKFSRKINESIEIVGEFITPILNTKIIGNDSNNAILFSPALPAEFINTTSGDYFVRFLDSDDSDLSIRYFGDPDSENMINTLSIGTTAITPSLGSKVVIGLRAYVVNLNNTLILNKTGDGLGSSLNSSVEFVDTSIFNNEKFFKPIDNSLSLESRANSILPTVSLSSLNENLNDNISRLRKVGDYCIDYKHGVIYVSISKDEQYDLGFVQYNFADIETINTNVLSASGVYKKTNAFDNQEYSRVIYQSLENTDTVITPLDIEHTTYIYDDETRSSEVDGEGNLICVVTDDYTVELEHPITAINCINLLKDVVGENLTSKIYENRYIEDSAESLTLSIANGGKNLYESSWMTITDNVVDLKKRANKRIVQEGDNYVINFIDDQYSSFVGVNLVKNKQTIVDNDLNIYKISSVQIVNAIDNEDGTSDVSLIFANDGDEDLIDASTDYVMDVDGNIFEILSFNTETLTAIVAIPASNNSDVALPTIDDAGNSFIVEKAVIAIDGTSVKIYLFDNTIVSRGDSVEVVYLTNNTPDIGEKLAVDYSYGSIYCDYSYIYDDLYVSYEYGDNQIDWSINNAIDIGEDYYVSYRYGALRDALQRNFGVLTNIPFFNNFPLTIDRELYRDALSGTLQSFAKGPTIPAFTKLINAITKVDPNITEWSLKNWILGRDILDPTRVDHSGVIKFAPGKFNDGIVITDGVSVTLPSKSNIRLEQGTFETWIRPEWSGRSNDAQLTFDIENIGEKKFRYNVLKSPFSSENSFNIISDDDSVISTDYTAGKLSISNFRSSGTADDYEIIQSPAILYRSEEAFDRTSISTMKCSMSISDNYPVIASSENSSILGALSTAPEQLAYCGAFDQNKAAVITFKYAPLLDNESLNIIDIDNCSVSIIDNLAYGKAIDIIFPEDISLSPILSNNINTNTASSLFIIDDRGAVYDVISIFDENNTETTQLVANISGVKIRLVSKNIGQSLSNTDVDNLPHSSIAIFYKYVECLQSADAISSSQFYSAPNKIITNWNDNQDLSIIRDPLQNKVSFIINSSTYTYFYTDLINQDDFESLLDIDNISDILSSFSIGVHSSNIYCTTIVQSYTYTINFRYSHNDIYIGRDSYNPRKSKFSISKDDDTTSPIGIPNNIDTSHGLFIGFDELCYDEDGSTTGSWVVRSRVDQYPQLPTSVIISGNTFTNVLESIYMPFAFSGVITTDGQFSSVLRSHRLETDGSCASGDVCNASYRYCADQKIEDAGWSRLEDTSSDLINVIIGGRQTNRVLWAQNGNFDTNVDNHIYRMGESSSDGVDGSNIIGNLVYTKNPCYGQSSVYVVSLKVIQFDSNIANSNVAIIGDYYTPAIIPIAFSNEDVHAKVCIAINSNGISTILLIDGESNSILASSEFEWNNESFNEYKVVVTEESVSLIINNSTYASLSSSLFQKPSFDGKLLSEPSLAVYLFDNSIVNSLSYHNIYNSNIIDIDSIEFASSSTIGDDLLEDNDILTATDNEIVFEFKSQLPDDGYADGYSQISEIDEIRIISDKDRYILDSGESDTYNRISIFKDGKGFLNFRIFDKTHKTSNEVAMYNIATSIKHFIAGDLHHIAASWKLNTFEQKDEMHLFIDGQEVPSLFKFGGMVPVRLGDKYSDVSREVLHGFLDKNVIFYDEIANGSSIAGSDTFISELAEFDEDHIGRSIIITASEEAPTYVGISLIISEIDGSQIKVLDPETMLPYYFDTTADDISFKLAPAAGIISDIKTDLANSRFFIYRNDGSDICELGGILYTVNNGEISIVAGNNVDIPKFRANIDTRIIEFVGKDSSCLISSSIDIADKSIYIETAGLLTQRFLDTVELSSSSYAASDTANSSDHDNSGLSILGVNSLYPTSLADVGITRVLLNKTAIEITDTVDNGDNTYTATFDIEFDANSYNHRLTSQSGQIIKQNLGRYLTLEFETDNIQFCSDQNDGYASTYPNTITIFGETVDGDNYETISIDRSGSFNLSKSFISLDSISGSFKIIDPEYFELGVISLRETNAITVSDNGGDAAEIYKYRNGEFVITVNGTNGEYPFELHPGYYIVDFPVYLKINIPQVGDKIFIGTDIHKKNAFGGTIDELVILSECSSDTRGTENDSSGTRSVTDDYSLIKPFCISSEVLSLLHFDNPIDAQMRKLRTKEFLDTTNNYKYKLTTDQLNILSEHINDEFSFISKMMNMGFSYQDSLFSFHEAHRADGGPILNYCDVYANNNLSFTSSTSVNDDFGKSGIFSSGPGILYYNSGELFRPDEGMIEFWISPLDYTDYDENKRFYIDIGQISRVRVKSINPTTLKITNSAKKIISIKLINSTTDNSSFYSSNEVDSIVFDSIQRSQISGVLSGGSGTDKDYSVGSTLSSDGLTVNLIDALPTYNCDVIVTYITIDGSEDRFSVYKNEYNQIVFNIHANGVDNMVSADIDWSRNTWHRVLCIYRTNSSYDTMRIFIDGQEGGQIRYGTRLLYGDGFVYGQISNQEGALRNVKYSINISDDFRMICIGSDIYGDNCSRSRIDNIRFSRKIRDLSRDSAGIPIDINFSNNTDTINPVKSDDLTTLMVDFDDEDVKQDFFATVKDSKSGIYDFDIEVKDLFDKITASKDTIEDLIYDLVNRLRPAHSNAIIKFLDKHCRK